MLKFLTSLSFLYAISIIALLLYGIFYYRNFAKARFPRRFPVVFLIIGVCCVSFLWVNFHAPMTLKTFSNLDHQFIRHDGFEVRYAGHVETGEHTISDPAMGRIV